MVCLNKPASTLQDRLRHGPCRPQEDTVTTLQRVAFQSFPLHMSHITVCFLPLNSTSRRPFPVGA